MKKQRLQTSLNEKGKNKRVERGKRAKTKENPREEGEKEGKKERGMQREGVNNRQRKDLGGLIRRSVRLGKIANGKSQKKI